MNSAMGSLVIMVGKDGDGKKAMSCVKRFEKNCENSLGAGRNTKAMIISPVRVLIVESTSANM